METFKVQVKLETVTPLFLGGADPRGEPELRASSFRGALRFWLRALLGGVLGDRPQEVFRQESCVFGSTDHASPVIVRLEKISCLKSDGFNPLPHKKERFTFRGFALGQQFNILLLSRNSEAIQQAQNALWLLCHLGGLGRRSRRGFGSLQIAEGELALTAKTAKELATKLKQKLDSLLSSPCAIPDPPHFPTLHPSWAQIKVCEEEFENWKEAIQFVMDKAHDHKNPALGSANPRQASPVHIHVTKLQTGKYALIVTTMLSQLNPKLLRQADRHGLANFLKDFPGEPIFGFKEVPEKWLGGSKS